MKLKHLLLACGTFFITATVYAQLSLPPNGGNQRSVVRQHIGGIPFVEITYNSPDVAGREQIWGSVVPYGLNAFGFGASSAENPSPWRAGANENTTIEFSHDMTLQGEEIEAGIYGFHVVVKEDDPWEIHLTSESNAWGSFFYHPDQVVLKVESTPEEAEFQEFLTYEFTDRKVDQATVALIWEKKKLPLIIGVPNVNDITLAQVESQLNGALGFQWNNWSQAANWASGAGYHEKALLWADAALSRPFVGQQNFTTLQTKANVLVAKGDEEEAMKIMDEAIKDPSATVFQVHAYGRQLIGRDKKDEALEVFKYNHKKNEGAWPSSYGLARGYSAVGDYKQALKYIKIAQKNVPANDTINPPVIETNIAKLEKGEDIN